MNKNIGVLLIGFLSCIAVEAVGLTRIKSICEAHKVFAGHARKIYLYLIQMTR